MYFMKIQIKYLFNNNVSVHIVQPLCRYNSNNMYFIIIVNNNES